MTDLSIDDGSVAWKLCMDIVCLSYDGNLADGSLMAAMSALMCLELPGTQRIDDEIVTTAGEGFDHVISSYGLMRWQPTLVTVNRPRFHSNSISKS